MKKNIESLEALCHGLLDGGCNYVTNFPGFYSHDIFSMLGGKNIALNEKVAYEMGFGASLAGARTVVTFKSFGLNVAADPFLNSMVSGINAGLVLILTEDVEVMGSQCRQDSRYYRDFYGGLWFEPTNIQEAYEIAYNAFKWSEELDIPIVIRVTNQFFEISGEYERQKKQKYSSKLANNKEKYVVHPINSQKQRELLRERNCKIQKFIGQYYLQDNKLDQYNFGSKNKEGCLVFGICNNELELYANQKILPVSTYPLPTNLIRHFVRSKKKVNLLEQGNDYGLKLVKQALDEKEHNIQSNTGIIPDNDESYINFAGLEKLFSALKSINPKFVVGDLSQFTNETTKTIQACLCMGASVPITMGLSEVGVNYPFCVTGDASLTHAGIGIINEALALNTNLGIIIIDNGGSVSTGGQSPLSGLSGLDCLSQNYITELHYDNTSTGEFKTLFDSMQETGKSKVIRVITN